MAYIQPNRSPPTQPFYYSPYPTAQSFSSRSTPSTSQTYVRSPPTSTSATPRSRTLSTSALPSSYGYAHPAPPQEPPNPFAEMGIDPVRMYLQSFSLPDTPENRRDAWEIVGRVAQRILDREEEEARARQSTYDEDDTDYAEFLAFKEYKRQKDRSHRSSESPARESGHRPYSRQYYPGQNPGAQVPQAGYCPSPPAQQPMLFNALLFRYGTWPTCTGSLPKNTCDGAPKPTVTEYDWTYA
ncbi:hypothetical protein FRC04_005746 [Tulasnella sp. 424]|nr:hypothetical protein FRC04_005746 [Tulasnella sp. 424]